MIHQVVTQPLPRQMVVGFIRDWASAHIPVDDQSRFRDVAEIEVMSLHEGNFARYRIKHSEFINWKMMWDGS